MAFCTCFLACKAPKDTIYFQDLAKDTLLQNNVSRNFDFKIKPDDFLYIGITSTSPEQSALFNAPQPSGNAEGSNGGTIAGYQVDKKGSIQLYKIGEVKVAGLTRSELKEKLQKELISYLKEPVVTVRFLNQRITILGEVIRPQVLSVSNEQITVLEAIGQSGDLTTFGRRDNILVIRQTEKGKEFKRLNLLDHSVFTSPYFYLQNEDVVYVEPNEKKKNNQKGQVISYIVSGVSLVFFVLDRLTR